MKLDLLLSPIVFGRRFLVEQAGYQIDEVHEEAENLEHSSSKRLVERLYSLMQFPKTDPHGSEIPAERFWEGETITP